MTTDKTLITRKELKTLINTASWVELGEIYGFEPKWTNHNGLRLFDWTSCSAAFWAAYQPESWSLEAQERTRLKRLEKEAAKKAKRLVDITGFRTPQHIHFPDGGILGNSKLMFPATDGVPAVSRRSRTKGKMALKFRLQSYADQNGICYYCKTHVPYECWTIDHKLPRSKGGSNLADNKIGACSPCNNRKGNLTDIEFFEAERQRMGGN